MLTAPLETTLTEITPLESSSNRPITFTFDYQVKSLIYYHTEEFTSAQALLEEMQDKDSFAYHNLVPEAGLSVSTFYEANSDRGFRVGKRIFWVATDSASAEIAQTYSQRNRTYHLPAEYPDQHTTHRFAVPVFYTCNFLTRNY